MKQKMKLGEVLLNAGVISPEELEHALSLQRGKNKKLGQVLMEMGRIDELQVASALSNQLSLPLIDCASSEPSREALACISKETAQIDLVFPVEMRKNTLVVAMANPLDWRTIENLGFETGLSISVVVSPENDIRQAIEKAYVESTESWDVLNELPAYDDVEFLKKDEIDDDETADVQSLYKDSQAAPIIRLVTMVITDAIKSEASDIHIEPRERNVQIRYRLDGNLKNIKIIPKQIQDAVISRIKIISELDITNRRFPQDGRSFIRLKHKTVDLRISTLPSVYGEKVVIRLLDPTSGLIPLKQLGISDSILPTLIDIINQPQGLFIVTGPTGSGKTTTLYSVLLQIRNEIKNIITLEEPVEYKLSDITQVGINEGIGFTFASALRSVLRQDPDIVMVGEIRDAETAEIAARASLTGHFVLSTLHTNDTVSTVMRLLDIGLEPFIVSASLTGILAQRLVRKICPDCRVETAPPKELERFSVPDTATFYRGEGCEKCNDTGYKGRVGIYELLKMNAELTRLITRQPVVDDIWEAAKLSGSRSLFEDAWGKITTGITTAEEVLQKIPYKV